MNKIKDKIKEIYFSRFLLKVKRNEWCFILPPTIGDSFLILSLIAAFREQNAKQDLIKLIFLNKKHIDILRYFPSLIDSYKFIIPPKWFYFYTYRKNELRPGTPIAVHPLCFFANSFKDLIGYKGINLLEIYKIMLNIRLDSQLTMPAILPTQDAIAKQKLLSYNLINKKVILLAPEANSTNEDEIPVDNWRDLAAYFHHQGFEIAMIAYKDKFKNFPNVTYVEFGLDEMIAVGNQIDFFVSLRSGLCDLIAASKCQKHILYPQRNSYSSSFLEWASINLMGFGKNISEYEFDNLNVTQIFDNIKQNIEQ
ncbi:MAG: hypothetical protein LBV75_02270 [Paludibacter sp.]|jgi:ADP-heptose:LPS heptosyltransferase|nr:hypothetical protein [Paludibacter sp.]